MDVTELTALIRKTPELLAKTRNVGQTGDWEDLYTVVDFLSYAFAKTYPTLPCRAGCSHCCEVSLFRVTETEWRAIEGYLEAGLEPELAATLKAQVRELYGPHRAQLETLSDFWSKTEWGTPGAPMAGLPTRCPFLSSEGVCSVYDVRPLVCRAYGSFGVTIGDRPTMLICDPYGPAFIDALSAGGSQTLTMAPVEPMYKRLSELAPGSPIAPLQLWVLRWAERE